MADTGSSGLRDATFILSCWLLYLHVRAREAVNLGDIHQKLNEKEEEKEKKKKKKIRIRYNYCKVDVVEATIFNHTQSLHWNHEVFAEAVILSPTP